MSLILAQEWDQALADDDATRAQWQTLDGGEWRWHSEGVSVKGTGPEWLGPALAGMDEAALKEMKNFVIEVTVSGKAEAAGLSFGAFKDFLARVDSNTGPRHLQLEVDVEADCWAFRIDGQLMKRCWWDGAVNGVADILNGALTLKVRHADEVLFQNLAIHAFEASCRLSVIPRPVTGSCSGCECRCATGVISRSIRALTKCWWSIRKALTGRTSTWPLWREVIRMFACVKFP